MKLEEQVCTLEQAIRLQELGIMAESIFNYAQSGSGNALLIYGNINHRHEYSHWQETPAFTVAELGEMLPDSSEKDNRSVIRSSKIGASSILHDKGLHYMCWFTDCDNKTRASFEAPTEAQARAAMLQYLLENKIISADEVNSRIS